MRDLDLTIERHGERLRLARVVADPSVAADVALRDGPVEALEHEVFGDAGIGELDRIRRRCIGCASSKCAMLSKLMPW